MLHRRIDIFLSIPAVLHRFLQERAKSLAELGEIYSILRPLRSSYPWLDLDEVGCGDAFLQASAQMHSHDFRRQKINWLSEHPSFRFNSAHPPADNAEAVDHSGV